MLRFVYHKNIFNLFCFGFCKFVSREAVGHCKLFMKYFSKLIGKIELLMLISIINNTTREKNDYGIGSV